jgi:hypothetical protein
MVYLYIILGLVVLSLVGKLVEWIQESKKTTSWRRKREEENLAIEDVLGSFDFNKERAEIEGLIERGISKLRRDSKNGLKL